MTNSFSLRQPGSAITHFIGLILALIVTGPLVYFAYESAGRTGAVSMGIFAASMILLYGASTLYHSVNFEGKKLKIFQRIDHIMIFVLIAGTYTPICLLVLSPSSGQRLLIVIWSIAAAGMLVKLFWITCPKWFSSILYTAMGWSCLAVFPQLIFAMSRPAFFWLLAGGILYTSGAVIYALKLPVFNQLHKNFGTHEIFHLFVIGGSICHTICLIEVLAMTA